jgi:hypothetical protein
MRTVLLDGSTGNNADLPEIDGVVDFRPGQFFVTVFGFRAVGHWRGILGVGKVRKVKELKVEGERLKEFPTQRIH